MVVVTTTHVVTIVTIRVSLVEEVTSAVIRLLDTTAVPTTDPDPDRRNDLNLNMSVRLAY